jgi:3-isopropylmalate dehydrogenase
MNKTIAVLPGDGIGEEVMAEAIKVLRAIESKFGHAFQFRRGLVGGAAWDVFKSHFPEETRVLCSESDAILFGSVGGPVTEAALPKWKGCETNSILAIRKAFNFNANYRPAKVYPELAGLCPLRADIVAKGIDVLVIRELLGDIYFGAHRMEGEPGSRRASDVAEYNEAQIRSVAHLAFQAARTRRKKVTSVDKANVLDISKLWRIVVQEVHAEYKEIELEIMLVDNCAMQLILKPSSFDVILTSNMFGDILSDEAAVFPGSLGLTPSASINAQGFGLYEPSGGSAPDIAGKGIANPTAQILSAAMMLRNSFAMHDEASLIEKAVSEAFRDGARTRDLFTGEGKLLGTSAFGDEIGRRLKQA